MKVLSLSLCCHVLHFLNVVVSFGNCRRPMMMIQFKRISFCEDPKKEEESEASQHLTWKLCFVCLDCDWFWFFWTCLDAPFERGVHLSAGRLVGCLDCDLLVSQFDSFSMDVGLTLGHRANGYDWVLIDVWGFMSLFLFLISCVRNCSCLSFSYAYLLSEGDGLRGNSRFWFSCWLRRCFVSGSLRSCVCV